MTETYTVVLGTEKTPYELNCKDFEKMFARAEEVRNVMDHLEVIFDRIVQGQEFDWREEAEDMILASLWSGCTCDEYFTSYVTHELIERTIDAAEAVKANCSKEKTFSECLLPGVFMLLFESPQLL